MIKKIMFSAIALCAVLTAFCITADKSYVDRLHQNSTGEIALRPTYQIVTNIVTNVVTEATANFLPSNRVVVMLQTMRDYVWDAELEVCYKRQMVNGYLEYIAVTNVDLRNPANW